MTKTYWEKTNRTQTKQNPDLYSHFKVWVPLTIHLPAKKNKADNHFTYQTKSHDMKSPNLPSRELSEISLLSTNLALWVNHLYLWR